MVVELLDEGPCRKRMKIEIPAATITQELDENYGQLRKNLTLPGFRPGHVPRLLIEKRYAAQIEQEVREELIHNAFHGEVERRSLQVLGHPTFDNIEFKVGEPLRFQSVFEVAPSFELPEYRGLEVESRTIELTPEQVTNELEDVRAQCATFEPVEPGEQAQDDIATVAFALVDGAAELLAREDVYLKIGLDRVDNILVPDLGQKLIAARAGEAFEVPVSIPDDFPRAELRGRQAVARVTVKQIARRRLPPLDDELAKRFGYADLEEFRAAVHKGLASRRTHEEEARQEDELLTRLAGRVEMELPASVLESQKREIRTSREFRLMRAGKSREEAQSLVEGDGSIEEEARNELKKIFLLDQIVDRERILVTEDEVEARLRVIALAQERSVAEVRDEYQRMQMLPQLRTAIFREKALRWLRQKAKVSTGAASTAEGALAP